MDADLFAQQVYAKISANLPPRSEVPLVEYATEADAAAIDPETNWFEQRVRNTELGKLLAADGHTPIATQINPTEFNAWCGRLNKTNTSSVRAEFAAWIVAGRPDDFQSIGGEEEL